MNEGPSAEDAAPNDRMVVTTVPCRVASDRYVCSAAARSAALTAGFDARAAAEVAICASELGSNAVRHGSGGELEVAFLLRPRVGIELRCRDVGAGIPDVGAALEDGWSRGRHMTADDSRRDGLGSGLGTIRRLMDDLVVERYEGGTVVIARKLLELPRSRRR